MSAAVIERLRNFSESAEPELLPVLCLRLADATRRCEKVIGRQPEQWWILLHGGLLKGVPRTQRSPEVEEFIGSLGWTSLRFFLDLFAAWEETGRNEANPYEPLVEICRRGGSLRVAGDGLLDIEDYTGDRLGVPIASTFLKGFTDPA